MEDTWYSGLRVSAERPVNENDLPVIADLRRERLRHLMTLLSGPPLLLLAGLVASTVFSPGPTFTLACSMALYLTVAIRPWITVPAILVQLGLLARDSSSGIVITAEGKGSDLVFVLDRENRLQPASLVNGSKDEQVVVEFLSNSGAILRINGREVSSWNEVTKGHTATKSDHARLAAGFVVPHPENPNVAYGERPLSLSELLELQAHASPLVGVEIALLAALLAVVVTSWWHAVVSHASNLALPILSGIAFFWFGAGLFRRWRLARRFAPDARYGRVIIVVTNEGQTVLEFLALSGVAWSENHVPATWRRLPLLRRTFVRRGGA